MWPNRDPVDQRLTARFDAIAGQVLARRAEEAIDLMEIGLSTMRRRG